MLFRSGKIFYGNPSQYKWHPLRIDLPKGTGYFSIELIQGKPGLVDVAIDDISLLPGPCQNEGNVRKYEILLEKYRLIKL